MPVFVLVCVLCADFCFKSLVYLVYPNVLPVGDCPVFISCGGRFRLGGEIFNADPVSVGGVDDGGGVFPQAELLYEIVGFCFL